ncbi:pyruvate kinase isoform X1 [Nilaparvata lugens]|uniref:pyruvate kinase isoform X1 n=1 Tax=Nilaparvata lugens TaxID=108931 RepID=UPI00193CC43B|nr:pyruvate kinase isoform X1 [Nilaparvata lugens]
MLWESATPDFLEDREILNSIDESPIPRLSKIICTINSRTATVEMIEKMIESGMDIARLNFAHDDAEHHLQAIANIRKAVKNIQSRSETHLDVAIAIDTKGPEIRIGMFEGGPEAQITLIEGKTLRLSTDRAYMKKGNSSVVYIDYEDIHEVATPGMKIFISSAILTLDWMEENDILCSVLQGGVLTSYDEVTGEGMFKLKTELSAKDLSYIELAIQEHVDCLFLTYTMSQDSVLKVKHLIKDCGGDMLVFAKIQNKIGLMNIKEILNVADGLIVCRHDLGIEFPSEKVFCCQKMVLARCKEAGKPCICSNSSLHSMVDESVASYSECFDLGNSVLDCVDGVLLSKVTAIGRHSLESIRFTAGVCKEAESVVNHKLVFDAVSIFHVDNPARSVAFTAVTLAFKTNAQAIIVISTSGSTAKWMSVYHPPCPIVAISRRLFDTRKLCFYRAIFPVLYKKPIENDWEEDIQERWKFGVEYCKQMQFVEAGNAVIVVTGWKIGASHTNSMKIVTVT